MFKLDTEFIYKLKVMIESGLIWYKHYSMFCDYVVEEMENPPLWIQELSTMKSSPEAIKMLQKHIDMNNGEDISKFKDTDLQVACFYHRFTRKELSWATFLNESGRLAEESKSCKEVCEYFYFMLNDLEERKFSKKMEDIQRIEIDSKFRSEIDHIGRQYKEFENYFSQYTLRKFRRD